MKRVTRSVMVLFERLNAARAIRPTVAALRPVRSARTISGILVGIERTPTPRTAIPIAPGNLSDERKLDSRRNCYNGSRSMTHDQRRKARNPASVPFLTSAMENASCVDPGPGSAFPRAKRSLNVMTSSQLSWSTNLRRKIMTCTPGPPKPKMEKQKNK
jgi:hypothetical protein